MAIHSAAGGGLGGQDPMEMAPTLNRPKNIEPKILPPKIEKIETAPETVSAPTLFSNPQAAQLLKHFESLPPVLHKALVENQTLRKQLQEVEHLTEPRVPLKPSLPAESLRKLGPTDGNPQVHPLPQPPALANRALSPIKTETVARNPVHGDNGSKIKVKEPVRPVVPPRNDNGERGPVTLPEKQDGKVINRSSFAPKSLPAPSPQLPIGHLLDLKL